MAPRADAGSAIAATAGVVRRAFGAIGLALDTDTSAPDAAFDPFRLQRVVASRGRADRRGA